MEVVAFDIMSLGPFWAIVLLLLVAGTASFFLTEIARRLGQGYKEKKQQDIGKRLWWWRALLRLLAVLAGAGAGYMLVPTALGAGLGFVGGVLNAVIVTAFKERVAGLFARLGPSSGAGDALDGPGDGDDDMGAMRP